MQARVDPATIYLLVFNDPQAPDADYGLGWTLVTFHGSDRERCVSLAGYGAGAHAGSSRAQAVAAWLLGARGVAVTGWGDGARGELRMFRAVLDGPAAHHDHVGATGGGGHTETPAGRVLVPQQRTTGTAERWNDSSRWLG